MSQNLHGCAYNEQGCRYKIDITLPKQCTTLRQDGEQQIYKEWIVSQYFFILNAKNLILNDPIHSYTSIWNTSLTENSSNPGNNKNSGNNTNSINSTNSGNSTNSANTTGVTNESSNSQISSSISFINRMLLLEFIQLLEMT